jgi:hypothetical protein
MMDGRVQWQILNQNFMENNQKVGDSEKMENPELPPYINKRKIGHENIACKGKTWKLVDGNRVWFEKE